MFTVPKMKNENKIGQIRRMRERNIAWKDIAYVLETSKSAARMLMKRADDVAELGEKPVIIKSKFATPVVTKMKEVARDNPDMSIRDLAGELRKIFPTKDVPSSSTIHRHLGQSGFKMVKVLKKTMIWPRNQAKRLNFCREMAEYGPAYWESVIWSDETTVRQMPQGKELVFRVHASVKKDSLPINPQIHSGGFSVMFWGCFSKMGLGPLVACDGMMNAEKYVELLRDVLLPELEAVDRPMIFMQDNAPCHKARIVMTFLAENNISTLEWPPQSPDMNPIENLWAIIKRRRQKKFGVPKTQADLIEQIFETWNAIDQELVSKLSDSASERVNEVLKLKGKVSRY